MIFAVWIAGITAAIIVAPSSRADTPPFPLTRFVTTVRVPSMYRGHSARYWHRLAAARTRQLQRSRSYSRSLRRTLLARQSVTEAINLSCATYGNCAWLWRVARCESKFRPKAQNPHGIVVRTAYGVHTEHASGLMQFLLSTWRTTPYGSSSIWSPYASALAAGWMASRGRASEWVCR